MRNNPVKYIDPTGNAFETGVDLLSVGTGAFRVGFHLGSIGAAGFDYYFISEGNDKEFAAAYVKEHSKHLAVASVELGADTAAAAIPGLPGGSSIRSVSLQNPTAK